MAMKKSKTSKRAKKKPVKDLTAKSASAVKGGYTNPNTSGDVFKTVKL